MEHILHTSGNSTSFKLHNLVSQHWMTYEEVSEEFHLVLGVVATIVGIISLTSNGFILRMFYRYRSLRISSNLLVLNLAITDTFLALGNLPWLAISSFRGYWIFGYIGCQVYGFIGAMAGFISINTLTVIAIERFFVIVIRMPWKQVKTSSKTVCVAILFIWIYSFMWAICPLIGWGSFILEGSLTSCTFDFFSRDVNNKSYVVSILVFCFSIQLFLIVCSYVRIFLKVLQHEKEIVSWCSNGNESLSFHNRRIKKFQNVHMKTAKVSLVIISIFCISWIPYAIIATIGNFGDASVITPLVSTVPGIFAKVSTVLNPMIYALLHPKFRSKLPFHKQKIRKIKNDFKDLMKLDNEMQTSSVPSVRSDTFYRKEFQRETVV